MSFSDINVDVSLRKKLIINVLRSVLLTIAHHIVVFAYVYSISDKWNIVTYRSLV